MAESRPRHVAGFPAMPATLCDAARSCGLSPAIDRNGQPTGATLQHSQGGVACLTPCITPCRMLCAVHGTYGRPSSARHGASPPTHAPHAPSRPIVQPRRQAAQALLRQRQHRLQDRAAPSLHRRRRRGCPQHDRQSVGCEAQALLGHEPLQARILLFKPP